MSIRQFKLVTIALVILVHLYLYSVVMVGYLGIKLFYLRIGNLMERPQFLVLHFHRSTFRLIAYEDR